MYIDEIVEGISNDYSKNLNDQELLSLLKLAEEKNLMDNGKEREKLRHWCLEQLKMRSCKSRSTGLHPEGILIRTFYNHFESLSETDANWNAQESTVLASVLIILGNLSYTHIDKIVLSMFGIDKNYNDADRTMRELLDLIMIKREKTNPHIFREIILHSTQSATPRPAFLCQTLKNNLYELFKRQEEVVDTDPTLSEVLGTIRKYTKNF